MSKQYTYDDIPMILNAISWNLKRIADSLEDIQVDTPLDQSKIDTNRIVSTKLRQLIDKTK